MTLAQACGNFSWRTIFARVLDEIKMDPVLADWPAEIFGERVVCAGPQITTVFRFVALYTNAATLPIYTIEVHQNHPAVRNATTLLWRVETTDEAIAIFALSRIPK